MRDPARIDRICELLKQKWKIVPDQRLGQFLLNYVFGKKPPHTAYIFYMEDDDILDIMKYIDDEQLKIDREIPHLQIFNLLRGNPLSLQEIQDKLPELPQNVITCTVRNLVKERFIKIHKGADKVERYKICVWERYKIKF